MRTDAARGPRRFDFGALSADEFEELCYLIVHIDFPDAVRLANPDRGADCGVRHAGGKFSRCWQAKRFTGHISWPQCERSLDAAVANYGMPHYTFCFARNLTNPQHQRFHTRLAGRHCGVAVDYWNHWKLEAMLLSSEQGERIANHFYEDPAGNARAFMNALRAGGPLETGVDVVQRLEAIADFLAANDPYYGYVTVTREAGTPGPSLTPATIISVETGDSRSVTRIDAVPRNPNALQRPPEGTLYLDDTHEGRRQRAELDRFFREGGDLRLDGVRFELRNLPPLFDGMEGGSEGTGTILLSSPRTPIPPWDARFIADTDRGRAEIDVLLRESDPPPGWDAALSGTFGGLTVTVMFGIAKGRGHIRTHWSYTYSIDADVRAQARVLSFIDALSGIGTVAIEDNSGSRPTLTDALTGRELDPDWTVLKRLMESLVIIEDWTGHKFDLPEFIPADDVRQVIIVAQIIRDGKSEMNIDDIELVMPVEKYEEAFKGPGRVAAGYTFGIEVLGAEVWIGELRGEVPDVDVETKRIVENGQDMVQLFLRPTTEKGRHPVFTLFPAHYRPADAPSACRRDE